MSDKIKVRSYLLKDMKKYVKGFNPDNYVESDENDTRAILFLRGYYDEHLPVDVTAWMAVNEPEDRLIFKKACAEQVCFVRDVLADRQIFADMAWDEHDEPLVISHHYSKSVKLPVFKIEREDYGIELILRCNIYDWKISVKSKKPLDCDFMDLFDTKKVVSKYCCEGFPKDKIYGSYEQDHSKFTVEISSDYNVYAFFLLLRNYLGIKNTKQY